MSEFKSEVLPSGIEFREDNNVYLIVDGGDEINLTRLDIARMYGIAHPTKRRTGECCNVQSETTPDQVTNVPDIIVGDIPQTIICDKYKENVRKVAEEMAIDEYGNKYIHADEYQRHCMCHEMESKARITVRRESEAVKAAWITAKFDIDAYLIGRGPIPTPVSCAHGVPCTEICSVCGINSASNEQK